MPKIQLSFNHDFFSMHCDCGMEFVLLAVLRGRDEDGIETITHMDQATATHCPYCGNEVPPNAELCGGPSGPSERAPGSALTDQGD